MRLTHVTRSSPQPRTFLTFPSRKFISKLNSKFGQYTGPPAIEKLQSWLSALFYAHSKSFSWRAMINENCLFSSTWQGCLLQPSNNVFITYCHVKNLSKLKNCAFLQQISRILSCNDFDSLCEVTRSDTRNLNCVPIHTVTNLRKSCARK